MHWLDPFFPPFCQGCGTFGKWVCGKCWANMQWLAPQPQELSPHFPSLKWVLCTVQYDDHSQKFVQGLKYARLRVLAKPLGQAMARTCGPQLQHWRPSRIVPVPLHPKRQRYRGFNQAGMLAQSMGQALNIPVEWELLQRTHWQKTQAQQGKNDRQTLHHSYRCARPAHFQTVCLVDDVCTTGATLAACARALNQAGVKNVIAVTFARA